MSVYGQNPIVYRLSQYEIDQCKTPSAVTYNFIQAILCRDFNKMMSYASPEYYSNVMRVINNRGLTYDEFFEEAFTSRGGDKLNILGWIPALTRNYEVAIAYVQDTWYYNENGSLYCDPNAIVRNGMVYLPGEETPRVGINEKKVYVTCSPSTEVDHVGFQDITRYGNTNVKVLLEKFDGIWKVTGFK